MKTDNELIALHSSLQDKAAFSELVTRYQSSIRQFLRRLTAGDHHQADDLAQETFLLMYKKLHSYNGAATLATWLHKIAYNCFLKYIQNSKKIILQDDYDLTILESTQDDLVTDIMLEKLMAHLTINERLTLTLNYSAGMSHGEIAEVTKLPLGTVKSHINRAKGKLSLLLIPKKEVA